MFGLENANTKSNSRLSRFDNVVSEVATNGLLKMLRPVVAVPQSV